MDSIADRMKKKFLALVEPMDILKTAEKLYRDMSERNLFEEPLSLRENMFYNGRMFERVTLALIELGEDVARFEQIRKDYATMVSTASEDAQEYFSALMMGELWKDCANCLSAILAKVANKSPKTNGKLTPKKGKRRGRKLTANEVENNKRKNELITEIRRRADKRYSLGITGITKAYEEIDCESLSAGSKWRKILPLAKKDVIINKATKNERYKETM